VEIAHQPLTAGGKLHRFRVPEASGLVGADQVGLYGRVVDPGAEREERALWGTVHWVFALLVRVVLALAPVGEAHANGAGGTVIAEDEAAVDGRLLLPNRHPHHLTDHRNARVSLQ